MPDASPAKWHLAHTSWFFDTFVLSPNLADFKAPSPAYRLLFNSYYNAVGEPFPRARRGLISRPDLAEVLRYRHLVDQALATGLADGRLVAPDVQALVTLGVHHEQQHQELLLTDIKHLLSCNPLGPAYRRDLAIGWSGSADNGWQGYGGGIVELGAGAHEPFAHEPFTFDNEGPSHRVLLEPYELARRLVTNGEYLAFIEARGYEQPQWWMSDGWAWRCESGARAPLYWRRDAGGDVAGHWNEFTLGGVRALASDAPVCHVNWYEAEAFARFSGARLPTEAEWEHAARLQAGQADREVLAKDPGALHPLPAGALQSRVDRPALDQLYGDVWQWTASAFLPYPGFRAAPGAVGEYNGKFMCNQFVLRGSSCVTSAGHSRATYRNFFPPDKRWQFTGMRLAR